ncbi:hypothetical protein ABZZ80_31250, partial [Streptomyces sp. NPDC006356]
AAALSARAALAPWMTCPARFALAAVEEVVEVALAACSYPCPRRCPGRLLGTLAEDLLRPSASRTKRPSLPSVNRHYLTLTGTQ